MAPRLSILVVIGVLLAIAVVPVARADTIAVTAGVINVPWDDPPGLSFQGEGGFSLTSLFFRGSPSPLFECFTGCAPGTSINLSSTFGGTAIGDLGQAQTAIVDGVTYASPSVPESFLGLSGTLVVDAPAVVLPPLPAGPPQVLSLTAPFLFQGQVAGFLRGAVEGDAPLFVVDLVGRGSVDFELTYAGGEVYRFFNLAYDFEDQEPIPEPMSMLLVGSGLAGMAFRARLSRRKA